MPPAGPGAAQRVFLVAVVMELAMSLFSSARARRSALVPGATLSRAVLLSGGLLCLAGLAPAQNVKPPKAQLWMDVSTGTMAGMPEMEALGGMGGMLGGFMGGRAGGASGSTTHYGQARGMHIMPPRVLDIALYNRLNPGVAAAQFIPAGMKMGESLPLVPPPPTQAAPERESGDVPPEYERETPRGRILIYWGCGRDVRPGQPRIVDLTKGNPADFGAAFAGRYVPERGVRVGPGHALYPNEGQRVHLGRDSSLVGEHQVRGEGVPASMKFNLGAAQDLMPAIELQSSGRVTESIALAWRQVPNARAYYLHAMGQVGKDDMVMWSSAETPDTGMGLFDYLPHATIDRWLKEGVLLPPDTTHCDMPQGIFASPEGGGERERAMLRMMAYGSESHFVHPPRPADPKAPWEPEWAVRVRVKSQTMAMLGQDTASARGRGGSRGRGQRPSEEGADDASAPATAPARREPTNPLAAPVNILKGLLGR